MEEGINLHDVEKLFQLMKPWCAESLVSYVTYPKGNPHGVSYRELHGVHVVADYLTHCNASSPDSLFLVHDTQLVVAAPDRADDASFIVCKFTANGSRLYTVSAEQQGVPLPDPAAVQLLHSSLKRTLTRDESASTARSASTHTAAAASAPSGDAAESESEQRPEVKSIMAPVSFRGAANKYDRYKKQKVSTLGAYVQYSEFSESSLKSTSTRRKAVQPSEGLVAVSGGDVMIAPQGTTFGFSPMLPVPVVMCLHGVMKLYLNADQRMHRLDFTVAFK